MILETLKNNLIIKKNKLEEELKSLKEKAATLPKSSSEINLSDYGSLSELKKTYPLKRTKNPLKKLLGPNANYIKKQIYNELKKSYSTSISKLTSQIAELEDSVNSIAENRFQKPIFPNTEVIKELLSLVQSESISPKEGLNTLIELFKISQNQSSSIENKISTSLLEFFDSNNQIKKDSKLRTVILFVEKIFYVILTSQEQHEFQLAITIITDQIRLDHKNLNKENEKSTSKASKEPVHYPHKTKEISDILHFILNNDENSLIDEAAQIISESPENEFAILLSRIYQDIISLCKFIKINEETSEYASTAELITPKIKALKLVISQYKDKSKEKEPQKIYYLTNEDFIPIILSTIESTDIIYYPEIIALLENLAEPNNGATFLFQKSSLDFYAVSGENISIIYTRQNNEIVILKLVKNYELKTLDSKITGEIAVAASELHAQKKTPELISLHQTFENLIAASLDLTQNNDNLLLHKQKKD